MARLSVRSQEFSWSGSVYLSRNEGSATEPSWANFEYLIKCNGNWSQSAGDGVKLTPGHGSRVYVVDFNCDKKLDLLVGDATTIENKMPGLTVEEARTLEREYNIYGARSGLPAEIAGLRLTGLARLGCAGPLYQGVSFVPSSELLGTTFSKIAHAPW